MAPISTPLLWADPRSGLTRADAGDARRVDRPFAAEEEEGGDDRYAEDEAKGDPDREVDPTPRTSGGPLG